MSNSVFQSVIVQLKDATDRVLGVMDASGCVVACTDVTALGERWADAAVKVGAGFDGIVVWGQKTFKPMVGTSNFFEYAVFCTGEDELARGMAIAAYVALSDAKNYYEDKHDRGTFVKNIIMDNILPGDIYIRAKELHFSTDTPRAVFLVRQLGHGDVATVDVLSGMFLDKLQDFVLSINETDIAVVKQITSATTQEELEKMAASMEETLGMWASVRRGEERWIFPYQDNADALINTTLLYEPSVLKKYVYPLLKEVTPQSKYYAMARDIVKFLNYILDADIEDEIPPTSIMREFIGGNTYYRK